MDFMLPFKVGDDVESRTFSPGFRGAWFRCKISDMSVKNGHMECQLKHIDYPGEKKRWTRLYKLPPGCGKQKSCVSRKIMLRPPFPQWHWENQISECVPNTDVVAIVSGPWKVGDLIDWWYTGCYWTGKIMELLGDDKVKIVCPKKPIGEDGSYVADCKDLRPALDWSLEKGWIVPLSQENGKCWHTARLIAQNPDTGSSSSDEEILQSYDGKEEVQKCLNGASHMPEEVDSCLILSASNSGKYCINNQTDGEEEAQKCLSGTCDMRPEVINSTVKLPPNQNGECHMSTETDSLIPKPGDSPQVHSNGQSSPSSFKRRKTSTERASVEQPVDTVDDSMLQLEKISNHIRWAKDLLLSFNSAPSNATKTTWKIQEKDASEAKHK